MSTQDQPNIEKIVAAARTAVEGYEPKGGKLAALNLTPAEKALAEKILPAAIEDAFEVAVVGVNAGLNHVPGFGVFIEGVVDPLIMGFEPQALAKVELLLGL